MDHCQENSDADNFIASFLFPEVNGNYVPSTQDLRSELSNINDALSQGSSKGKGTFKCRNGCNQYFRKRFNRERHESSNACLGSFTCEQCNKVLTSKRRLQQHLVSHELRCPVCDLVFVDRQLFLTHCRGHAKNDFLTVKQVRGLRKILKSNGRAYTKPSNPEAAAVSDPTPSTSRSVPPQEVSPMYKQEVREIFRGRTAVVFTFAPEGTEEHSLLGCFTGRRAQIEHNLRTRRERWTNLRWYLSVSARMLRLDSEGNIRDEDTPTFRSKAQVMLVGDDLDRQVDEAYFKINASLENFCTDSSGWILDKVVSLEQTVVKYVPLGGSCADFLLPVDLATRRCLISVVGRPYNSSDCFIWSVVAAIHGKDLPLERGSYLHFSKLAVPRRRFSLTTEMQSGSSVSIDMIDNFECTNDISVNVFGYEDEDEVVFPIRVSKRQTGRTPHADILLLSMASEDDGEPVQRHYCAITDLGRLVFRQQTSVRKIYVCPRCLTKKYSSGDLSGHLELCNLTEPVNVVMPSLGRNFVRFRNYHRQMEVPFVIVARFETFRIPILDLEEPTEGITVRERKHDVCAFSYFRLSVRDSNPSSPVTFVGKNSDEVMTEFLSCMESEQTSILSILGEIKPMIFCDEGIRNIAASNDACSICDVPFVSGDVVVLDHCHVSSVIRGRAHSSCNLSFRLPKFIPVVLENMSSHEGRLILSANTLYGSGKKITVIAKSIDTYASVTIDKLRFIDFSSFFKAPLEKLIQGLELEEGSGAFSYANRHWPSGSDNIEYKRVPVCRDYLQGPERLAETRLPDIDSFRDKATDECLSPDDYTRAVNVWNKELRNKTMRDYLEFAIVTDCLFMADIIATFRQQIRRDGELKLDPMQYLTMASFAWDSALRLTQTCVELPTDIEMYLMVENALRGGLAVVGTPRFARANDPRLDEFDPSQPQSSLEFFDFNGLYTSVMAEAWLPQSRFRFLSEWELERFDFRDIPADNDHGYILEVDLTYPSSLHDEHNDFPLAPEHLFIKKSDMSAYTRETADSCGINLDNLSTERRLCLTLTDKKRYTVHYRNLQFYVEHGLVVSKIHRVLAFSQMSFLQPFMEYCSSKRQSSRSDFYSSVYKNMANMVAGKTGQNPRHFSDVRICADEQTLQRLSNKQTFQSMRVFSNNLVAVQLYRPRVLLNSPIAVNFAILELSKLRVYSFLYDFIKPVLAQDGEVQFLSGDTDSLVLKISGVDNLMDRFREHSRMFDFSNLPQDHELYDVTNKKVPGKVKFELPGHVCEEFIALSPKCYSMKSDRGFKQARKGSTKELRHDLYKQCLLSSTCHRENVSEIRHYGQTLYNVSVNKRVLSVLDVKRHHVNSVDSLSLGHYSITTDN